MFEAIVSSNGWDGVTAALQLLSHLNGDALNVALLVPESRHGVLGFFDKVVIRSLQRSRASGRIQASVSAGVPASGDDPSIFAIELETLARRVFIYIDTSIQLQMVRDRFINGQAECALRRHLDSLGPNTPIADIVDCCRVWESHREVESTPRMSADRCPARAICQITEDEPSPAASPETGNWEAIIRKWLPVGAVTEEDAASPDPSVDSAGGCFSCRELTHMTDQCRTLDESFPFLPTAWQAEHIGDQFILGPGPPARPQSQQMGNTD